MIETYLVHPGYDTPIEARATQPEAPGYYGSFTSGRDWFVLQQDAKFGEDRPITPRTALSWGPVFACVRFIASTIASLDWNVYEIQADGRTKLPVEDPVAWLLHLQPNPEQTAMSWRECMLKDALTWGNGYAEIERSNSGRPLWMWRIDPQRVLATRDGDGPLYYTVYNRDSEDSYIPAENVFHLKAIGEDGLVGLSPISLFRRTIRLGWNQQGYADSFFRRGPTPGGILKLPGARDEKKDAEQRDSFERTYGSSQNAGRVVVLRGGAEFTPLSFPNSDAQLIEAMEFTAAEIARIYGVPPHKIGIMKAATNNNIEQQAREAVQDCLMPWARRLETEANLKLFGRNTTGRRVTKICLAELTKGDSITQANSLRAQVTGGIMLIDEAREELGLNPLEDGIGSEPLIQGAMAPLDRILNPPEPTAPPPTAPMPDTQPSTEPQPGDPSESYPSDAMRNAFASMLSGAYERLLRVEGEKAARANKGGQLNRWSAEFYGNGHAEHIANSIEDLLSAFALAIQAPTTGVIQLAGALAADHIERSRRDLAAFPVDLMARAGWQAGEHIRWAERSLRAAK